MCGSGGGRGGVGPGSLAHKGQNLITPLLMVTMPEKLLPAKRGFAGLCKSPARDLFPKLHA